MKPDQAHTATAPQGWRAALKALAHFDPAYPYNPVYEYECDSTTDPDYGVDGINFITSESHKNAVASFQRTVHAWRGRCAPREFMLCLSEPIRQALGPDHEFRNRMHIIPNLVVLPNVVRADRAMPQRQAAGVEPPPLLVLQVPSAGTWRTDLGPRMDVCAAMGIQEYWLYDADGLAPPDEADDAVFRGWRLNDTGGYAPIPRIPGNDDVPVYHSDVLGGCIRMVPAKVRGLPLHRPDVNCEQHFLQWRHRNSHVWRDPDADPFRIDVKGTLDQAMFHERLDSVHTLLAPVLPPDAVARIDANWRTTARARTLVEVANVWRGRGDWRSLLFPVEYAPAGCD